MSETRGAVLQSTARNNVKASRHRMWAVRWRRKYGVKSGRIRFGEPLSESNKRRKVGEGENLAMNFLFRGFGDAKILSPIFRDQILVDKTYLFIVGHKSVPKNGPHFFVLQPVEVTTSSEIFINLTLKSEFNTTGSVDMAMGCLFI